MPLRKHSTTKHLEPRQTHRITLPISRPAYKRIVVSPTRYRGWVEGAIRTFPGLFPGKIAEGFTLHDQYPSKKMNGEIVRRIKQKASDEQGKQPVYTVTPSYLRGVHKY
jgi:hypothetical protein